MKYVFVESIRRVVQIFFGFELFEFPWLNNIRAFFYKLVFEIGESPIIGKNVRLYRVHKLKEGKIQIGRNVLLGNNVEIDFSGKVAIGDNVWLSDGVQIHSHIHKLTQDRIYRKKETIVSTSISIESCVWIGSRSIILPGVKMIGKNSIVGSGSVVTKSIPANVIVAGNPARIIKELDFKILDNAMPIIA